MWWGASEKKHLPIPEGPYAPGCIDIMTEYSKEGSFVRLFYPTNVSSSKLKEESAKWIRWMEHPNYEEGFASVVSVWVSLLKWSMWLISGGNLHIPALHKEAPNSNLTAMKTVVFSHGFGACRFVCSTLCCELASRGYVVAAVEHRDESACATYYYASSDDKEKNKRTWIRHQKLEVGSASHYTRRRNQIKTRSRECSKALDLFEKLNNGDVENILDSSPWLSCFKGKLDTSDPTGMGHSFGAATCAQVLNDDERFKRGVLLDCWMFPLKDETNLVVKQPLLFLNTQTFHIKRNLISMEKIIKEPADSVRSVFTIRNTTHESQTDLPLVWGYWLDLFMKKLSSETALRIQNHLVLKFMHNEVGLPEQIEQSEEYLACFKDVILEGLIHKYAQPPVHTFKPLFLVHFFNPFATKR